MNRPDLGVYLATVSHLRPANVPALQAQVGPLTWVVPAAEVAAYERAGAAAVLPAPRPSEVAQRNLALEAAFSQDLPCLQLDDDLRRVALAEVGPGGKVLARPVPFAEAHRTMYDALRASPYYLAGGAPTDNPYFYRPAAPLSFNTFLGASWFLIRPNPLRYDESLTVKGDYDYAVQHLARYGGVVRCNFILASFPHYTNAGGWKPYRTDDVEADGVRRLRAKWGPAVIRDHPRRPNEVALRWPPPIADL